jgi:hypothetical protein
MLYDDFDEEDIDDATYGDSGGEDYGDSSDDFDDTDDETSFEGGGVVYFIDHWVDHADDKFVIGINEESNTGDCDSA